jgi:hypothetical protein
MTFNGNSAGPRPRNPAWCRRALALATIAATAALALAACAAPPKAATAPAKAPAITAPASSAPPSSPRAQAGLTGTWSGQYSGSYHGNFTVRWRQSGTRLTGTIKLSSSPGNLPIHGSVHGSAIKFGTVGSSGITYSGTVSGNSMSGTYQVGPTAGNGGPWSASKA